MLQELSNRQLDVRELIDGLREQADKSMTDALAANVGYDDELVAAVVLIRIEMSSNPDREVEPVDIIWAGEFLDHLDTQGFEIRSKTRARRRPISSVSRVRE